MSNFLSLNLKDFFKGFLMAILVPALLIVQQSLESGVLTFNWKQIAIASISGAIAYLLKNILTNSDGNFLNKESDGLGGGQVPPNKDEK